MKTYDVILTVNFKRPIQVNACCGGEAVVKAKEILFNSNLIEFTEDNVDSVVCEVKGLGENLCDDCEEECNDSYCSEEREYLYDELY